MFIRAIKSQLNLKPYFYAQSAKVGAAGCILGGVVSYNLWFMIAAWFGLDVNTPLRSYESSTIWTVFALCFLCLLLSLYIFCVLIGAMYYRTKLKNGHLNREEYKDIVFRGIYPKRWQKGL